MGVLPDAQLAENQERIHHFHSLCADRRCVQSLPSCVIQGKH